MRSMSNRLKGLLGATAVVLVAGAVVGTVAFGEARPTWVTVSVPGAQNVAVYCGGETRFADGEQISFSPEGSHCELEAPLSAAMPLRGRFEIHRNAEIKCARHDMDLTCE